MRRLEWSQTGSTLLALIVGLTLTLVCQGHIVDNQNTGPHLTFLGEADHNGLHGSHIHTTDEVSSSFADGWDFAAFGSTDSAGTSINGADPYGGGQLLIPSNAFNSSAFSFVGSSGANLVTAISNTPLESTSLATLSYMLGLSLLWRGLNLRSHEMAATTRRKSQTGSKPEPPPPRPLPR